jgi:hypothetical protein
VRPERKSERGQLQPRVFALVDRDVQTEVLVLGPDFDEGVGFFHQKGVSSGLCDGGVAGGGDCGTAGGVHPCCGGVD